MLTNKDNGTKEFIIYFWKILYYIINILWKWDQRNGKNNQTLLTYIMFPFLSSRNVNTCAYVLLKYVVIGETVLYTMTEDV